MNSIKRTARIAGLLYFLQLPLGVFGLIYVSKALKVSGVGWRTHDGFLAF